MDWFVIAIIAGIICLLFFLNRKKQADHEFALKMMSPPAEDHSRSKVEHGRPSRLAPLTAKNGVADGRPRMHWQILSASIGSLAQSVMWIDMAALSRCAGRDR